MTLGSRILERTSGARETILLCAPFIKQGPLEQILGDCTASCLQIFTRWRPEEVAAGVSDTSVLSLVKGRGGSVHLCDALHAKYYRFDDQALIGSANLTGAALGWSPSPNLELLVELPAWTAEARQLEAALRAESVAASEEIAEAVEAAASLLPASATDPRMTMNDEKTPRSEFVPNLREPKDLYRAYRDGPHVLASSAAKAARADLYALDLPGGLTARAFRLVVGARLLQLPSVVFVDELLATSQRFGAISDALARRLNMTRADADRAWQALMRWLLEFLPARYEYSVPGHSELMRRRDGR